MRQASERATRPSLARGLWERWKQVARGIGDAQARILLTLFYFSIFAPFALIVRWGMDPLTMKTGTGWRSREDNSSSQLEQASRQF